MSLPSRHRSVRGKLVAYLTPNLNIKVSLAYILVFVAIVVADSTIVKFFTYSGVELPTFINFTIFIVFFVIFAVINITLLYSTKKNRSEGLLNLRISLKYFHKIIFSTQILTFGIIILIILQMSVLNKYSKMLLQIETYVTHIVALIFLFQLVVLFAGWFKSKRSLLMLLYTISFALISSLCFGFCHISRILFFSFPCDRHQSLSCSFVCDNTSLHTVYSVLRHDV